MSEVLTTTHLLECGMCHWSKGALTQQPMVSSLWVLKQFACPIPSGSSVNIFKKHPPVCPNFTHQAHGEHCWKLPTKVPSRHALEKTLGFFHNSHYTEPTRHFVKVTLEFFHNSPPTCPVGTLWKKPLCSFTIHSLMCQSMSGRRDLLKWQP